MSKFLTAYEGHTEALFAAFIRQIAEARKAAGISDGRLFACLPALFDKWLRSAAVDGTLLTPLNLLSAWEARARGRDGFMPVTYLIGGEPRLAVTDFGGERHPILNDMQTLADAVDEAGDLNEPRFESEEFLESFAVPTPRYVAFVAETAVRLGVLRKMPAVNARVYCKIESPALFERDSDDVVRLCVQAVAGECARQAKAISGAPPGLKPLLQKAVAEPISTAELLQELMGGENPVDSERMAEALQGDGSGEALAELMGDIFEAHRRTAELALLLERHFFIPLDRYLGVIRAAIISPLNAAQDLAAAGSNANGEAAPALCAGWQLTGLGERLYGADGGAYRLAPCGEHAEKLLKAVEKGAGLPRKLLEQARGTGEKTAVIEIRPHGARRSPALTVELPMDAPLREIYSCVSMSFGSDPFAPFTIFEGDSDSPFRAYSSEDAPIWGKNAEAALVGSLKERVCRLVVYAEDEQEDRTYRLKLSGEAAARYGFLYPRQVEDDEE